MSKPILKQQTSIEEQITILQKRGLIINDQPLAKHYLTHVGYYRLAGYWQILQKDRTNHIFIDNTTFEQVVELYNFDRELRILLTDAIERIEVSLRTLIANIMCAVYGSQWYSDKTFAEDEYRFQDNLDDIEGELERSKEDFIKHHNKKYGDDEFPPAWVTMQVLSFGTLSKLYSNIKKNLYEKNLIAEKLGLPNYKWLESWMVVISVLRNYCAHHSRLCYRTFSFPPKELIRSKHPWIKNYPLSMQKHQAYFQLCIVKYILNQCSPGNHFNDKLKKMITKYPSVSLDQMGFLKSWDQEALWQ